jgi:hypothetical protein
MGMTPEEVQEWEAFCRTCDLDGRRMEQLSAMVINRIPEENIDFANEDERFFFRSVKDEYDNTVLPDGVIWWLPSDL